jgi:hypothetical protein
MAPTSSRSKIGLQSIRQGQVGVNVVESIVLSKWKCRWQPLSAVNDDGIDGLIIVERHGTPTGQIVYVQVKCYKASAGRQQRIRLAINERRLTKNVERWRRVVGAAILVHVHPETQEARWVDLRSDGAIGRNTIYVPAANRFDDTARSTIARLCGSIARDLLLPVVRTQREDFSYLLTKDHLQTAARRYYRELHQQGLRLGANGPTISFTRDGWRHITRPDRKRLTQFQSFLLLGTIGPIFRSCGESSLVPVWGTKPKGELIPLVALRALVTFPFRQSAIVKVVLKRREDINGRPFYSFHSIYEGQRERNAIGVRVARDGT